MDALVTSEKIQGQQTGSWATGCKAKLQPVFGCLLALVAAVFGATSGLLVKYVDEASEDQIQVTRNVLQFLYTLPILTYRRDNFFRPQPKVNLFLLCRGLFGTISNWLFVYALTFIPLGDVMALFSCNVVCVGLIAAIFLKEPCGIVQVVLSLVTVAGLILIARPTLIFGADPDSGSIGAADRTTGSLLAILAALTTAVSYSLIRKMGADIHYSLSMFHYSWIGLLAMVAISLSRGTLTLPCLHDLLVAIGSSACAIASSLTTTLALQHEKANKVTLVISTEVIFAFALQLIFLPYRPQWTSLVGTLLIVGSSTFITVGKIRKGTAASSSAS